MKRTRQFETLSKLLNHYQGYLKILDMHVRRWGEGAEGVRTGKALRSSCVRSLCSLLKARPNFNFRTNILKTLVPRLSDPNDAIRLEVKSSLEMVLRRTPTRHISGNRSGDGVADKKAW